MIGSLKAKPEGETKMSYKASIEITYVCTTPQIGKCFFTTSCMYVNRTLQL
jgi:hypothetical protein